MTADHRFHYADQLRSVVSLIVYPIRAIVNLPAAAGSWLSESFSTRHEIEADNQRLHDENLSLKARLQQFEALDVENRRLRTLLGSSFRVGEKTLIAELLSVDMAPFSQQLILNKGSTDGVFLGQPVLDADGLFGQIVQVGPLTSSVMLITDPNHGTPVEVNRNGLRTIANGIGQIDRLELAHIPNNSDIEPGDLLVTSGLGGRFPPGYPVAKVTEVTRIPGQPFTQVFAEPTGKLGQRREVLLVWTNSAATENTAAGAAAPTPQVPAP